MKQPGANRAPQSAYLIALMLLAVIYLVTVLPALGNDPIAGGDEGWIISASAKLAREGVFGTDLFAGFYGSEDRYYFNLPLHHLVLAGVFKVIGVGLAEARLVSVVFGLATLLLTFVVGRRIAGAWAGLLAAGLLVFLRLNLAPFSGLTLTDLGATVRYDLIAVPYGLAAVWVLLRETERPRMAAVVVAGLLVGLAALTQFVGAFFGLPLVLYLISLSLPWARRLVLVAALTLAAGAPFLPYAAFLAEDWDDFGGQGRTVEQSTDLLSPSFYWRQVSSEPDRYAIGTALQSLPDSPGELLSRPSARLALLLVGPLAALLALVRGRTDPRWRLLAFTLMALVLQLALFESTKRFVYWVVVVPFFCIAIAGLLAQAWQWRPRGSIPPWAPRLAAALVLVIFGLEGAAVAAKDVYDFRNAPDYSGLGRDLEAQMPEGAVVLGDNRLWPALQRTELRSLLLVFYETNPRISRERTTDIPGVLARIDPDYIVLSPLSREILSQLSPEDAADFEAYLRGRTEEVAIVEAPGYGPHQVLRVRK